MAAMARLNVGVLGLSHDHVWGNLRALHAGERGRLVAAAEPDPALRDRMRALDGGVSLHDSFDALLERRDSGMCECSGAQSDPNPRSSSARPSSAGPIE